MKHQLLIVPIILGVLLVACGEDETASDVTPRDTVIPLGSMPPREPGYDPANEELFEELVYKEYAYQATRIPKRQADSLLKAVIARTKDPSNVAGELEKAMAPLKNRHDSLARATLAAKYGITIDSVKAIIEEVKERKKGSE